MKNSIKHTELKKYKPVRFRTRTEEKPYMFEFQKYELVAYLVKVGGKDLES